MAKKIDIKYAGKDYTLEYTLASVKQMERAGFDIDAVTEKPATYVDTLFTGAFLENHGRAIKEGVPEKIVKDGLPEKMLTALIEMYREVLDMLIYDDDEREETGEKKLTWEKNF